MKKARSGLLYLLIPLGLAGFALFELNSENSKLDALTKDTFSSIYLDEISGQQSHYILITKDLDTFKINKEQIPELTWESFENFDFNKSLTIESYGLNISKLTIEPDQDLVDIDYIELKKQDIKDGPFSAFIAFSIVSLIFVLLNYFLPKLESWTRNKVEKGILKIKGIRKVKDFVFELEIEGIKIFIFHDFNLSISKYSNKSLIKVFIPLDAKEKLHVSELEVDYFEKNKYYSFLHSIPFRVNHLSIGRKIKSKFK